MADISPQTKIRRPASQLPHDPPYVGNMGYNSGRGPWRAHFKEKLATENDEAKLLYNY
jgi:hypothetical protein